MTRKKELRIGVIGAGGRGALAGNAHRPKDGVRLVAGADTDPKALAKFRETYGPDVLVTSDYREVLARKDIGAVFVTTPDFLHEEHAVAALKAGKAVYLEKPMAITIEGCDRILRTAFQTKCKLYVGHNMRHFSVIEKMKEVIDQGAIGEVKTAWCRHFVSYGGDAYFKDWHADRSKSAGLLLQKAAHDIDVLHWLCGSYTRTVTAMGDLMVYGKIKDRHARSARGDASFTPANWPPLSQKQLNPVINVEDVSMMLMRLQSGVLASYEQCHFTPDSWRNYTVIGTEGRLENFNDSGDCIVRVWSTRRDAYRLEGDTEYVLHREPGGHGGSDAKIVDEFVRFVRRGGRTNTSPVAARYAVAAGVMATESLRHGSNAREVPRLPPKLTSYYEAGQI